MENNWHSLSHEQVLSELNSSLAGLSNKEVTFRQQKNGLNQPFTNKPLSKWWLFLRQLQSPLIYLLIIASLVSISLGKVLDASVIGFIVIINSIIGFLQEVKAEKSLQALTKLITLKALVIRDNQRQEISSIDIVVGDVVILSSGQKLPADIYLLECDNLKIDESILTGESIPVHKYCKKMDNNTALADRVNMCFASTIITSGRGIGVVVAAGCDTQIGQIAKDVVRTAEEKTPLHKRLEKFSKTLLYATVGVAILIFAIGLARGINLNEIFLVSVAAAVAILPEGLPTVVTITLALGVYNMAKKQAIVRRMQAVETLGCINVIASDKTGTLTYNQMTVNSIMLPNGQEVKISGKGYEPMGNFYFKDKKINPILNKNIYSILKISSLCNDANLSKEDTDWLIQGDPTEGSLIVAAAKGKIYRDKLDVKFKRINEIPFSSEIQFMATLHNVIGQKNNLLAAKGTIEKILSLSKYYFDNGKIKKLLAPDKKNILNLAKKKSNLAYRTLAVAYQNINKNKSTLEINKVGNLIYLGFFAIDDPPRSDAILAVNKCINSGIRPIMITGDHPSTALAIGKLFNIANDQSQVVIGQKLEDLSEIQFKEVINRANIFARVTSKLKLKIVKTLQKYGYIVGVTGDGINDAPVLKKSDVGISMGVGGTDVAREASDMVLMDNNFATIVSAIEEGRTIFLNIRRSIFYLLSTNIGEIMILITSLILGLPLPLSAVQILWINLITDSTGALALAVEPKHIDVESQPPRSTDEGLITPSHYIRILIIGLFMTMVTMWLYIHEINSGESIQRARSIAFICMAVLQIANLINCRSMKSSIFKLKTFSNKWLIASITISFILTITTTQTNLLRKLFDTVPLSINDWSLVVLLSMLIIVLVELDKWLIKLFDKKKAN